MNINIYYGGRGLVDDPTILVINKIQEVLDELNVNVNRYNLYEMKNTITTLSQTVTEADGIILATTVEWVGMGGYMQTFLDSCWLYSDKSQILDKYMFPVVMARTYGEREVTLALNNSWEIIGGKIGPALSAYIDDTTDFEFNDNYKIIIEKYAENVYRTISQRIMQLPSSSQTIKNNMLKDTIKLTPQESEQLSKYASDDAFVKTQKQDIESLASIYKELLNDQENGGDDYYLNVFRDNFNPTTGYKSTYMISISDKDKMTKVIMNGCNGKMGQTITEICKADADIKIVAGIDLYDGIDNDYPVFSSIDKCDVDADVVIDFSNAKAVDGVLDYCVDKQVPVVLCTTGLSDEQLAKVEECYKKVAVLKSANMSLGINTLMALLKKAAQVFAPAGFDMEIVEKHHNLKLDAPSGTALALADSINEAMDNEYHYVYDRSQRREKRDPKEIGISAVRGGSIVGEHEVLFCGQDEVIEFKHTAYSKAVFAKGAVEAAKFLKGKGAGHYDMADVIAAK